MGSRRGGDLGPAVATMSQSQSGGSQRRCHRCYKARVDPKSARHGEGVEAHPDAGDTSLHSAQIASCPRHRRAIVAAGLAIDALRCEGPHVDARDRACASQVSVDDVLETPPPCQEMRAPRALVVPHGRLDPEGDPTVDVDRRHPGAEQAMCVMIPSIAAPGRGVHGDVDQHPFIARELGSEIVGQHDPLAGRQFGWQGENHLSRYYRITPPFGCLGGVPGDLASAAIKLATGPEQGSGDDAVTAPIVVCFASA